MKRFDAIVIGSGAGGAPVVERLARAGLRVLLVERGRRYRREELDRDEIEWTRRDRAWPSMATDPHTRRGEDGARALPTNDGWVGVMYGGGTVHMSGFFLPFAEDDARQASRMREEGTSGTTALDWAVPYETLARHYPTVCEEVGVSGVDARVLPRLAQAPALAEHPVAQRCDAVARRLGMEVIRTPRAILTAPRPADDRLACAYRLTCGSYGCPNDARGSMPVTYLRRAERTGHVEVWTETLALGLIRDGGDPSRVHRVQLKRLKTGAVEVVEGDVVVVACSAIESARLLLLSSINPGGQVGKNLWFSLYVDVNGWFAKGRHPEVMGHSPFIHRTFNPRGVPSADVRQRLGVTRTGALDVLWQHDNPIHRAERAATEGGLFWGRRLKERLKKTFHDGRTILCEAFGESVPHPGAYVDLDPTVRDQHGLPVARLTYAHHPRDARVAEALRVDGVRILEAMGCEDVRVRVPIGETLVLQGGTCRFSVSEVDGVTTPEGNVHGLKNVYVTDGGALPSSGTAPCTLTILANALRIADGIVRSSRAAR